VPAGQAPGVHRAGGVESLRVKVPARLCAATFECLYRSGFTLPEARYFTGPLKISAALDNPAKLSAELAALFPLGAIAAELTEPVPSSWLLPAELQLIAHCAAKRVREFTAGRVCAHRALQELGLAGFPVLAGRQREPIWPAGTVGSLTHTEGYAAAVIAREADMRALGIDCEVVDSVNEELWSRICTPAELARLASLPAAERPRQAALIFAAKEAFYKCQFPLTRRWVGFEDVVVEPADWPATAGSLRILPQAPLPMEAAAVASLISRFHFRDPWVIAGVASVTGCAQEVAALFTL